jgi:hypothetical protein
MRPLNGETMSCKGQSTRPLGSSPQEDTLRAHWKMRKPFGEAWYGCRGVAGGSVPRRSMDRCDGRAGTAARPAIAARLAGGAGSCATLRLRRQPRDAPSLEAPSVQPICERLSCQPSGSSSPARSRWRIAASEPDANGRERDERAKLSAHSSPTDKSSSRR